MTKFLEWYRDHGVQITWFIIGFLTMSCLINLSRGMYVQAVVDIGLAVLNYFVGFRR